MTTTSNLDKGQLSLPTDTFSVMVTIKSFEKSQFSLGSAQKHLRLRPLSTNFLIPFITKGKGGS